MSDQNPIHRDGGRRDDGEQPYTDAREAFAENEARVEESAPFPDDGNAGLTAEERKKLEEEAAANRLNEIGKDVREERGGSEGGRHGH